MGDQNSRRARRRRRGKQDPDLIYEFGRWMRRTISPVEKINLGNGLYIEVSNESWHEETDRG